MRRLLLLPILLVILAMEGVAIELLPESIKFTSFDIVPHWVLLFLILVTMYLDTEDSFFAIIYGTIFGLMTDIVYTGILGIYMFIIPFSLYIMKLLLRFLHSNFIIGLILTTVSLFLMEVGLYFIYTFLGVASVSFTPFIFERLIPTLIANLLFMIVIFYPSMRLITWIGKKS